MSIVESSTVFTLGGLDAWYWAGRRWHSVLEEELLDGNYGADMGGAHVIRGVSIEVTTQTTHLTLELGMYLATEQIQR